MPRQVVTTVDLGSLGIVPTNIAVDPTNGDVYIFNFFASAFSSSAIAKLVSDGAPTPSYTVDPTYFVPSTR